MKLVKLFFVVLMLGCFTANGEVMSGNAPDPSNPDLMYWLKADAITGLNDNEPVGLWVDSSANGRDFTGGLWYDDPVTHSPIYKVNGINGLPVVEFDSSTGQWVGFDPGATTAVGDVTMIAVVADVWAAANLTVSCFANSGNGRHWIALEAGNVNFLTRSRVSTHYTATADHPSYIQMGDPMIAVSTVEHSSDSSDVTIRAYSEGYAGDAGWSDANPSYDRLGVGAFVRQHDAGPAAYYDGQIAEVLVYNRALSEGELNDIGYYLKQKYSTASAYEYRIADVIETEGGTVVMERNQTSDTFDLVLRSAPASDVLVTADPNGTDIILLGASAAGEPVTLTFTPQNWDTPQTVTVLPIDNDLEDGLRTTFIDFTSSSVDPNFDNKLIFPVNVTIIDDDSASIILYSEDDVIVDENGLQDTYTITLLGQPSSDVYVYPECDGDPDQVTVSPNPIVFTTSNYDVPQTVTVTAIDDDTLEHNHNTTISHTVASTDLSYNELDVDNDPLSVTIYDNECGAWGYHPQDLNQDCYVNILDIVEMAKAWLGCTDPQNLDCDDML